VAALTGNGCCGVNGCGCDLLKLREDVSDKKPGHGEDAGDDGNQGEAVESGVFFAARVHGGEAVKLRIGKLSDEAGDEEVNHGEHRADERYQSKAVEDGVFFIAGVHGVEAVESCAKVEN
jgi:hypothetical protein